MMPRYLPTERPSDEAAASAYEALRLDLDRLLQELDQLSQSYSMGAKADGVALAARRLEAMLTKHVTQQTLANLS